MKMFIKQSRFRDTPIFSYSGWGTGYVVLDQDHPYFNIEYDNIPVDVHGGLTYGKIIDSHALLNFSPHLSENDLGKYIIGFDTFHYMDNIQNCPREYVLAETQRLYDQCVEVDKDKFYDEKT